MKGSQLKSGGLKPALRRRLRKLVRGLNISADELLFEEDERGPDNDLLYEFEALSTFDEESKATARAFIHVLIQQHQTKRLYERRKDQ